MSMTSRISGTSKLDLAALRMGESPIEAGSNSGGSGGPRYFVSLYIPDSTEDSRLFLHLYAKLRHHPAFLGRVRSCCTSPIPARRVPPAAIYYLWGHCGKWCGFGIQPPNL